jgi:hypothetical protein
MYYVYNTATQTVVASFHDEDDAWSYIVRPEVLGEPLNPDLTVRADEETE